MINRRLKISQHHGVVIQVQEKKVKKIANMNMDFSKAVGKTNAATSSTYIVNGGSKDKSSIDFKFPPGGIPSLRLPVVPFLFTTLLFSTFFIFSPLSFTTMTYSNLILQVTSNETSLSARCRRVYAHAHDYHINSISNNRFQYQVSSPNNYINYNLLIMCHVISDGETFVSADDLRINLWNLEISNQSFNIVDVKPTNMEDLTGINFGNFNFVP